MRMKIFNCKMQECSGLNDTVLLKNDCSITNISKVEVLIEKNFTILQLSM